MTFAAGGVAVLKSGGPAMTIVAVNGEDIECVWIGEEGELFRHSIPAVALEAVDLEEAEEDEEDEE